MPGLSAPSSPPDSGFVPRREFIREQKSTPNEFALLAIAGSSLIKLYSFPTPAVSALHHLFEQRSMVNSFREDFTQNMCEFTLDGKPWASPKAVTTEHLLLDILTQICQLGFNYLSTIDYGREQDDRLTIVFSKPTVLPANSRADSSLPGTPQLDGTASATSDKPRILRVPFALSFASATLLRVISPPLHSTPAILQAIRGSWPRGVVSEKKVGTNSFEFKLKGYRWFQEDTFAADSLQYILSLLSALDRQSFSLLTSLSLASRSRVKDLWIFTSTSQSALEDLSMVDSAPPSILGASHPDIKRRSRSADIPGHGHPPGTPHHHRRAATETSPSFMAQVSHQRGRSEEPSVTRQFSQTRKPAPRAQVPISAVHDADSRELAALRAKLPSTVSSSLENMTGIGAGAQNLDGHPPVLRGDKEVGKQLTSPVVYSTSPTSMSSGRSHAAAPTIRAHSPPFSASSTPAMSEKSDDATVPPVDCSRRTSRRNDPEQGPPITSQLLGPGAFRDSAFSSSTDASLEIPIVNTNPADRKSDFQHRITLAQSVPGGWQPSPIEERIEEDFNVEQCQSAGLAMDHTIPDKAVQQVGSRIESPMMRNADLGLRKSETAVVGVITPSPPPPLPTPRPEKAKHKDTKGSGNGWVLVNLESRASPATTEVEHESLRSDHRSPPRSPEANRPSHKSGGSTPRSRDVPPNQVSNDAALVVPTAQILAAVDAGNAKNSPKAEGKKKDSGSSAKRVFSLSRKSRAKGAGQSPDAQAKSDSSKGRDKRKTRSNFRDKLKHLGTPEAPRNDLKRRSLE